MDINHLPDVALIEMFSSFSMKQLLQLRLVCTKLKTIAEHLLRRHKRLSFVYSMSYQKLPENYEIGFPFLEMCYRVGMNSLHQPGCAQFMASTFNPTTVELIQTELGLILPALIHLLRHWRNVQ